MTPPSGTRTLSDKMACQGELPGRSTACLHPCSAVAVAIMLLESVGVEFGSGHLQCVELGASLCGTPRAGLSEVEHCAVCLREWVPICAEGSDRTKLSS